MDMDKKHQNKSGNPATNNRRMSVNLSISDHNNQSWKHHIQGSYITFCILLRVSIHVLSYLDKQVLLASP